MVRSILKELAPCRSTPLAALVGTLLGGGSSPEVGLRNALGRRAVAGRVDAALGSPPVAPSMRINSSCPLRSTKTRSRRISTTSAPSAIKSPTPTIIVVFWEVFLISAIDQRGLLATITPLSVILRSLSTGVSSPSPISVAGTHCPLSQTRPSSQPSGHMLGSTTSGQPKRHRSAIEVFQP